MEVPGEPWFRNSIMDTLIKKKTQEYHCYFAIERFHHTTLKNDNSQLAIYTKCFPILLQTRKLKILASRTTLVKLDSGNIEVNIPQDKR